MSYLKFVNENPRTLFGILAYVRQKRDAYPPLLDGIGISQESAYEEMQTAKKLWNQIDRRQYKHFIFSFDSHIGLTQDALCDICYQIGAYFSGDYQIFWGIHFDTLNTHAHYVLNTVNVNTGQKFRISKGEVTQFKHYINGILEKHSLSPIKIYESLNHD